MSFFQYLRSAKTVSLKILGTLLEIFIGPDVARATLEMALSLKKILIKLWYFSRINKTIWHVNLCQRKLWYKVGIRQKGGVSSSCPRSILLEQNQPTVWDQAGAAGWSWQEIHSQLSDHSEGSHPERALYTRKVARRRRHCKKRHPHRRYWKRVCPYHSLNWQRSNAKLCPPLTIKDNTPAKNV